MPTVTFIEDFDWTPPEANGRITIAYKAGMTVKVRKRAAEAAMAAGVIDEKATKNVNADEDEPNVVEATGSAEGKAP